MSSFLEEPCSLNDFIVELFNDGFTNAEMRAVLFDQRGIHISERHMKRKLSVLGLRKNGNSNMQQVVSAVQRELEGSGNGLGYRAMTRRILNRYGLHAPRSLVSEIQRELDIEGVNGRRRGVLRRRQYNAKGPNYLIHVDGYDKLKPYGFPIHGAIDGYSRRIVWLRVHRTNNDPNVVASFFLDFVKDIRAVPRCIRMDRGTENVLITRIQRSFREDHNDDMAGENSVLIGSSNSNQRIERWWRNLRQSVGQFFMNLFKDMSDTGLFSGGEEHHVETLRYCFYELIENDLRDFTREWNTHRIRPQSNSDVIDGKPDLLYFNPESFGASDFKFTVDENDVTQIQETMLRLPEVDMGCEPGFKSRCDELLRFNNKSRPQSATEAVELYAWIINQL